MPPPEGRKSPPGRHSRASRSGSSAQREVAADQGVDQGVGLVRRHDRFLRHPERCPRPGLRRGHLQPHRVGQFREFWRFRRRDSAVTSARRELQNVLESAQEAAGGLTVPPSASASSSASAGASGRGSTTAGRDRTSPASGVFIHHFHGAPPGSRRSPVLMTGIESSVRASSDIARTARSSRFDRLRATSQRT